MKKRIRLTESDLHNMVKESLKKVLNEIDYSSIPIGSDAIERNKWWKQQLDNDFPNHGIQHSNNWQDEYSKINSIQQKKEKEQLRKEQQKKEKEQLRKEQQKKEKTQQKKEKEKDTASVKYQNGRIIVDVNREDGVARWYYDVNGEMENFGEMYIELYGDNTWLPYEETYYGASQWMPRTLEPIIYKLFQKCGMRDDWWGK